MYSDAQKLAGATVQSGGSGYKAGDILFPAGGIGLTYSANSYPWINPTQTQPACGGFVLQVLTVDGSGAVLTFAVLNYGAYYTAPLTPNTMVGGSGSGCVMALTFQLYWQNAIWPVPVQTDLFQVISAEVLAKLDANLQPIVPPPGTPVDYTQPNRSTQLLVNYVSQIRQAIQTGNKIPLSIADGAIPPESVVYALNMTVWQLINSTPSLPYAILTEKNLESPMGALYRAGVQWMEDVRKGLTVTYPSDPDPSFIPPTRIGSIGTPADLESYSAPSRIGFPVSTLGAP